MHGGPIKTAVLILELSDTGRKLAEKLEKMVRETEKEVTFAPFKIVNALEAPVHYDICIHLDRPIGAWVPWGYCNIAVRRDGISGEDFDQHIAENIYDWVIGEDEIWQGQGQGQSESAKKMLDALIQLVCARRPVSGNHHFPPILMPADCPPISVVTPTRGRRHLLDIAFHNLMATDYPAEKIEWVVVEDADRSEDMASDRFINFQANYSQIQLKYIPIQGNMSVGEKRNIGVEHASNDIVLFMDDDDHYPPTSFRRRVAWLTAGQRGDVKGAEACACTTIALYDLVRGVSAVNVPPWKLPLGARVSEATLSFRKSFWRERPFGDVHVAEGEGWLSGREGRVLEIPPQQIIVAFSHGGNASSRRIPEGEGVKSGCFWGFPREYLEFVHRLAGVEIEGEEEGQGQGQGQGQGLSNRRRTGPVKEKRRH